MLNGIDATGDSLVGGLGDDVLIGALGADTLSGGDGADSLFGSSDTTIDPANAVEDTDADVIDGGAGADFLFFGENDTVTGGEGADQFNLSNGVEGSVTITDFDPVEDSLLIQSIPVDGVAVTSQEVDGDALVVTLSTGAVITLQGLTQALDEAAIVIVDPTA